jgi:hypothetical protein
VVAGNCRAGMSCKDAAVIVAKSCPDQLSEELNWGMSI